MILFLKLVCHVVVWVVAENPLDDGGAQFCLLTLETKGAELA
jgi:hypothetical protein